MLQRLFNLARLSPKRFIFRGYETDDRSGEVRFYYSYDNRLDFCDVLQFDHPLPSGSNHLRREFEMALDALNVACGLRYYQGFTPREIVFDGSLLNAAQREFFQDLYVNGLGEAFLGCSHIEAT